MKALSPERWSRVWRAATCDAPPVGLFARLLGMYSGRERHYHTVTHLMECLEVFDQVRATARQPAEVELAIWLHDAVYDPHSSTNEEDSAALAAEWLTESPVAEFTTGRPVQHKGRSTQTGPKQ